MKIELTQEQIDFLKQVLDNVQIGGAPAQVREALRLIDSIQEKLQPQIPKVPSGTIDDPLPAPPHSPAKVQNL